MVNILSCDKHGRCETAVIDRDVISQMNDGKPPAIVQIPCIYRTPPGTLTISIESFMKYKVYENLNSEGGLENEFFVYETKIDFGPICAECLMEWLLPKK